MAAISATRTIFRDDFNIDGPLSTATWSHQTGPGSFFGNTQIRDAQPNASGGNAVIQLDTYNPFPGPGAPTYYGTSAFTNQFFGFATSSAPGGIAFETRAMLNPNDANGNPANPSGLIAGFFPYAFFPDTGLHDEIDYEWIPKRSADPAHPNQTQTNVYDNEPFGNGHFEVAPLPGGGSLMEFHTYRIEWMPSQVRWLVDGVVLRVEKQIVPTHDMQLFMNIWAGESTWDTADYGNLPPVSTAAQNQTRQFLLDYVSVEALSAQIGTRGADILEGTAANDHLRALGGDDQVTGLGGDDVLIGGDGSDSLDGGSGNDTIRAGEDASSAGSPVPTLVALSGDELYGEDGNDLLIGGAGRDQLFGGTEDDRLSGGAGNDSLFGGEGTDRLTGDDGADSFVFDDATDSPRRAGDSITDFDPSEGDVVDLSGIDTDPVTPDDQGFAFIGSDGFTGTRGTPSVAELRWEAKARGVLVQADIDGDGRADLEIMVVGVTSMTTEDFLF